MQDFGSKITQTAADIYKSKATERATPSIGGQILDTVLEGGKKYYENAELTKNAFLDTFDPDTYEVELLPMEIRGNYTDFAQQLKNDVSTASEIAGRYSANPNSEEYRNAVKSIEESKASLQKNYQGYKEYAELRQKLLSNPTGIMDFGDENKAEYDLIMSEEGYKNLVNTKEGLMYKNPNTGEMKSIKELGSPKFKNPELEGLVTQNILNSGYNSGLKNQTEDIAQRNIRSQATTIASDRASAHQIMFYGMNNDPDTMFAQYYIIQKALEAQDDSYSGIVTITDEEKVALDVNKDGKISLDEIGDDVGRFTINQEAYDAKFKELKNNKALNYQQELTEFLVGMGMDQYEDGKVKYDEQNKEETGDEVVKDKDLSSLKMQGVPVNLRALTGDPSDEYLRVQLNKEGNYDLISSTTRQPLRTGDSASDPVITYTPEQLAAIIGVDVSKLTGKPAETTTTTVGTTVGEGTVLAPPPVSGEEIVKDVTSKPETSTESEVPKSDAEAKAQVEDVRKSSKKPNWFQRQLMKLYGYDPDSPEYSWNKPNELDEVLKQPGQPAQPEKPAVNNSDAPQNQSTSFRNTFSEQEQKYVDSISVDGSTGANKANILKNGKPITANAGPMGVVKVKGVEARGNELVVTTSMGDQDMGSFKKEGNGYKFTKGNAYQYLKGEDKALFDSMIKAIESDPAYAQEVLNAVQGESMFNSKDYALSSPEYREDLVPGLNNELERQLSEYGSDYTMGEAFRKIRKDVQEGNATQLVEDWYKQHVKQVGGVFNNKG